MSSSSVNLNSILSALGAKNSLDVTSIVNNLIYADRASERQWQAQQSDITTAKQYLNYYNSLSSTLTNDMNALQDPVGALTAMNATSSQSSIVSASAAAGTASGNHVVKVSNLASTASWYSDSVATSTTNLAAGTFTLTVGSGSPVTIQVGNGINTLQDVANYINGQSLGVSASIVNDSKGSRLAIVSNTSGDNGNFTVASSPSLGFTNNTTAWDSNYVAASTTTLNSGTLSLTVGSGSPVNIQIGNGVNTLDDLASYINGQSLGVTAAVVTDTNGARLSLTNTATNDASGFSVSMNSGLGFTQAAQGKNASLTVDGIPISSSTNMVDGAVTGLTLNLLGAAPDTEVTVSVTRDVSSATQAVNSFVSAYNTLVQQVNAQFKYNQVTNSDGTTSGSTGPMAGDSAVRMFQSDLLSLATFQSSASSQYTTLGSLGINMNDDGTLTVDSAALTNALNSNFSDVQTFFQGTNSDGFSSFVKTTLHTYTDSTEGAFTVDIKTMTDQYNSLQDEIDNFETYITSEQTRLTNYYNNVNVQLQQMTSQVDQIKALLDPGSSNK